MIVGTMLLDKIKRHETNLFGPHSVDQFNKWSVIAQEI